MRKDLKAVENTGASYEVCFENPIREDAKTLLSTHPDTRIENDGVLDLKTYYFENIPSSRSRRFLQIETFLL